MIVSACPIRHRVRPSTGSSIKKVKHLATQIGSGKTPKGGNEVYVENGVIFIRSMNVYDDGLRLEDVAYIDQTTDEEMSQTRVRSGDVLLNITGASIGRTCIVPTPFQPANVNQHVCIIRLRQGVNPSFVAYALKSSAIKDQIRSLETGSSREGLNFEQIGNMVIYLPDTLEEQDAVVTCLDRKTAEIDSVLAAKERMLGLLQEKRQALISRAVTRGLNLGVPMKDSGVEWLGEVPAHWEEMQLKRVLALVEYGIGDSLSKEGAVAVLRMGNIQNAALVMDDLAFVESVPDGMLLDRDDLLFNRTNSLEQIAKVGIFRGTVKDRVSFASYLVRLRVNRRAVPQYLAYLLNVPGFLALARSIALPSINQANLNPTRYGEMRVAVPPVTEQQAICEFIDREMAHIDRLATLNREQIAKLREYRQALISAAVTGKLDVREVAP